MKDCIIIGAGIIGLAIAYRLSQLGIKVQVLEALPLVGQGISSRNSAVLHAGIYYPTNSYKARLCRSGYELLLNFCQNYTVPHKLLGKLIVATQDEQITALDNLLRQGMNNGVTQLNMIGKTSLKQMEPAIKGVAAIYSPRTGIVDCLALIQRLLQETLRLGAVIHTSQKVTAIENAENYFEVLTGSQRFKAKNVINAAGISACSVAQLVAGLPNTRIPTPLYAKGNYFKYNKPNPFRHLIYPLPETAGLGIHATLDLYNNVRFGPDVEWVNELNYTCSALRKPLFVSQIKQYFPELQEQYLVPDNRNTGIRPKLKQEQDFVIQTCHQHGVKGLINLYGIESPGLTAALAIAQEVEHFVMQEV